MIYIFSIFNIPTNLPTNSLALIGCYWIAIDKTVRFGIKQTFINDYYRLKAEHDPRRLLTRIEQNDQQMGAY